MIIISDSILVEPKSARDHQLERIFLRCTQKICNQVNLLSAGKDIETFTTRQIAYCDRQVSYEDSPELRQLRREIKQGLL